MEYIEFTKFLTSLFVAIVTMSIRYLLTNFIGDSENKKIRSSSVELIDKVLNEREWKKKENRIVVEEAFKLLYSKLLSFYEIKILVYSEMPNSAFKTYLKYWPILEFNQRKKTILGGFGYFDS